jgi:hypothetical protein
MSSRRTPGPITTGLGVTGSSRGKGAAGADNAACMGPGVRRDDAGGLS